MSRREIYRWIPLEVENVQDYKPGGFHPVDIGTCIGPSDRYVITRKLGQGGSSTVWLAQDTLERKFVSVKILRASSANNHYQIGLYQDLSDNSRSAGDKEQTLATTDRTEWRQYILPMLSSFIQSGPNGKHCCMIFDPMGGTAGAFMRNPPAGFPEIGMGLGSYFGKIVLRQMLGALAALHARGIIHGDLHIDNVLLPLQLPPNNSREGVAAFFTPQYIDSESAGKVRRRDKKPLTENAPTHLIVPAPNFPRTLAVDSGFRPKVIDITGATAESGLQTKTPSYLQSPELFFDGIASEGQDIWAFGFAIYEVLTGCRPICGTSAHRRREYQIDEMMLSYEDFVGPLPPSLKAKWVRYFEYFDKNDRRNRRYPPEVHQIWKEIYDEEGSDGCNENFLDGSEASQDDEDDDEGVDEYDEIAPDGSKTWQSDEKEDEDEDETREQGMQDDDGEVEPDFQTSFELVGGAGEIFREDAEAEERYPQNPSIIASMELAKRPPPKSGILEDAFDHAKPSGMGPKETDQVKDLLRSIFQYDPQKRPRAVDLQKDPWFVESLSNGGHVNPSSTTKKGKRKLEE